MATHVFDYSGPTPMDVELKDGIHPVGRDQENAIVIVDPSVSARHARLTSGPDGWYVEDLKSSNGTFVNHRPVSYAKLNSGDVLRFGKIETEFLDDELTLEATSTTFLRRKHWRILVTWSSVKIVPKSRGKTIEIPFREASRMIVMNPGNFQITVKQVDGRDLKLTLFPHQWKKVLEDSHWTAMTSPWAKKLLEFVRQDEATEPEWKAFVISMVTTFVVIAPIVYVEFPNYPPSTRTGIIVGLGASLQAMLKNRAARRRG